MSGPSSGLGRLAALLEALDPQGLPSTPREIAELIWLGQRLPEVAVTGRRGQESRSPAQRGEAASPHGQDSDNTAAAAAAVEHVRLYLPEAGPSGDRGRGQRAAPMRVAGAAALPRRRALVRALRPLKRRVPSRTRTVLDEDATADAVARDGRWRPVLVPANDRWLNVNLIIDACGDCADLWSPLGCALQGALQELGAFREVRSHWLHCQADGTPALATGTPRHGQLRTPGSTIDSTGRTVTLVLTDGVAPLWQTPALRSALRRWATTGPTAILQTLPDHLWDRTALAPEPGRLRSPMAGAPNSRLDFSPYNLRSRPPGPDEVPLPVLGVEPEWLAPWALAVAGTGTGAFDGPALVLRATPADAEAPTRPAVPFARRSVSFEEFVAQTEPRVFRLAAYLAATPLNLPVMRLVQSVMLPHSPPSDLAEIVFSGLLHQVPGDHADNLDPSYDFAPGVRHRLLSTLRRDEADAVISAVSTHVNTNTGDTTARFTAAAPDATGPLQLPSQAQHWAAVRTAVRRRQGHPPTADKRSHQPHPEEVTQRLLTTEAEAPWSSLVPTIGARHDFPNIPDFDARILISIRKHFINRLSARGEVRSAGVSVGAGTNIYPALLMLPWCDTITLLEEEPQTRYIHNQLGGYDLGWDQYWDLISRDAAAYATLGTDPRIRFSETVQFGVGGLTTLRNFTARWDVGIISFAADSSPASSHAFWEDIRSFMNALCPGATFAAIFMHQSASNTEEVLRNAFARFTDSLTVVRFGDVFGDVSRFDDIALDEASLNAPVMAYGQTRDFARGLRGSMPPKVLVDALEALPTFDEMATMRESARMVERRLGSRLNVVDSQHRRTWLLSFLMALMKHPDGLQVLGSVVDLLEGDTSPAQRVRTAIAIAEAPVFPAQTWAELMDLLSGLDVPDIARAFREALGDRPGPLPAHCTDPWLAVLYAATLTVHPGEPLPCVLLVEHLAQYAQGQRRQKLLDWARGVRDAPRPTSDDPEHTSDTPPRHAGDTPGHAWWSA